MWGVSLLNTVGFHSSPFTACFGLWLLMTGLTVLIAYQSLSGALMQHLEAAALGVLRTFVNLLIMVPCIIITWLLPSAAVWVHIINCT